jgi:hypothetical protein
LYALLCCGGVSADVVYELISCGCGDGERDSSAPGGVCCKLTAPGAASGECVADANANADADADADAADPGVCVRDDDVSGMCWCRRSFGDGDIDMGGDCAEDALYARSCRSGNGGAAPCPE